MVSTSENNTQLTVRITVMERDHKQVSAMAVNIATQDIDDALQRAGYETRGVYTGIKGASSLEVITEIAQTLYANKELIAALIGLATPIVAYLLKQREDSNKSEKFNSTINIFVANIHKSINIDDLATKEKLLAELLGIEPDLPNNISSLADTAMEIVIPTPPKNN